jgi:hypothetical protein
MLWDETRVVQRRRDANAATDALLTQMAVASLFDKEAGKEFSKLVKRLANGD